MWSGTEDGRTTGRHSQTTPGQTLTHRSFRTGQHPKDTKHLLQGKGVPEAHPAQGHSVQGRQGLAVCSGKAPIRPQAVRLRWSDQACLPQEGQDYQEGCVEVGVRKVQDQGAVIAEAMQAL